MHPFGRASPSVINRLIKAGSLLSPTCPSGDIRAIPSVSQAATPMKPRANPGNRTRQPKGCADRIAKPARLSRTSQNHLMMIILNKTGATTVAQHDCEPLAVHAQSETAACKRHVLCANFSKTRALFLLLSHRPQRKGRAGAPHGGVGAELDRGMSRTSPWSLVIVFWRVVWYLRGRDRINVVPGYRAWPSYPSCLSRLAVMSWPWLWRPWPWPSCLCCLWTCRRRVVATRRRMLVFAMVLAWSVLTQFALHT